MEPARALTKYRYAIEHRDESGPPWLQEMRCTAVAQLGVLGWPHHRQESWRFTDVTAAIEAELEIAAGGDVAVAGADIAQWSLKEAAAEIVFVDGVYSARLSRLGRTRRTFSLASAILADHKTMRREINGVHDDAVDAFVALNGALFRDGPFVHVKKGAAAGPIHVLHVATGKKASHPRGLIVVENGAEGRVVESFVALDNNAHLTNSVTEIVLKKGARLDYDKVVDESSAAYHLATTQVALGGQSRFNSNCLTVGGKIVRNAMHVLLEEEEAETHLRGLYIADADRLTDNALFITHAVPRCLSRIAYRGILNDAGRGVFTGSVLVAPGAQKTDSNTTNNNLVLSDEARIDTKPQLKIFADDVKCTHGATVGQHSPEAIYYFKTRGIDEPTARRMLTCGFAAEILRGLKVQSLEDRLEKSIFSRFGGGDQAYP